MLMRCAVFRRRRSFTIILFAIVICFLTAVVLNLSTIPESSLDHLRSRVSAYYPHNRKSKSTYLCLLIFTAIRNMDRRAAIRDTWLSEFIDIPEVVVFFVIGVQDLPNETLRSLMNENNIYNDLLLLHGLKDNYTSLTHKLSESLTWIDANIEFRYLLKVDDDSFVMLNKILHTVHRMPRERLYWGFFDGRAHVKHGGKWAESDWILCDNYLPYALGGGYALSYDLVSYVAKNRHLLKHYRNEDVSLGAWLSPLDIQRLHDTSFDTEAYSRGCHNDYVITHKQSIEMMREKWHSLKTNGVLCTKVYRMRQSHIYNWSSLPSKCCQKRIDVP